jgi:hypothetical protein
MAAEGALAPRPHEQLELLILLMGDADPDIRALADDTLTRIPTAALQSFLSRSDVPEGVRAFFAERGVHPSGSAAADSDAPLIDASTDDVSLESVDDTAASAPTDERESTIQVLAKMGFTQRLKAAVKGTREMRAILVRDPNKLIAASVLSSPKLTEQEVESFSRMANVSEDVLRIIGTNRSWTKNYGVVVGLTKNPKTPLAMSMNLMARLNDRDLTMLSIDRNVPEPLRVAARKKVVSATSKK